MKKASLVATALAALVLAVLPAQARAEATTSTVVLHGLTRSDFNTDICGRLATFTFTVRTQVIHLTEHEDGSLSFNFIDTGTYHVDYVDPALADQNSQWTVEFPRFGGQGLIRRLALQVRSRG